jgi:hypothetical protein
MTTVIIGQSHLVRIVEDRHRPSLGPANAALGIDRSLPTRVEWGRTALPEDAHPTDHELGADAGK